MNEEEKIRLVKEMRTFWEVPKNANFLLFNSSGHTAQELRKLFVEICTVYIDSKEKKNDL